MQFPWEKQGKTDVMSDYKAGQHLKNNRYKEITLYFSLWPAHSAAYEQQVCSLVCKRVCVCLQKKICNPVFPKLAIAVACQSFAAVLHALANFGPSL